MSEEVQRNDTWGIYNRLRELRRSKGLSQKELADELGLGHRSIGYFENQDFEPSLRLAWRIADYFGVELEDVFYRDQHPPREQTEVSPPPHSVQPSGETVGQPYKRPASLSILTALLDGYGADQERLARRASLDAGALEAELYSLKEEGLVEESVQPGPVFGRPHSVSYRLTSEGHKQIVEIHRNHRGREDE